MKSKITFVLCCALVANFPLLVSPAFFLAQAGCWEGIEFCTAAMDPVVRLRPAGTGGPGSEPRESPTRFRVAQVGGGFSIIRADTYKLMLTADGMDGGALQEHGEGRMMMGYGPFFASPADPSVGKASVAMSGFASVRQIY